MHLMDWLVIFAYGALMLGVGVYYSLKNSSTEEYLLGGRRMSPIALGLSLFATLVSTLSYLGVPGEMISNGPMMVTQLAAHPLIFLIVGYGLIPFLMKQPVTSAYEILESKLGMSIRLAGAAVFLLLRIGWMATILFATSKVVLVPLLGLSSSTIPWLCISLGLITALYSSWGGIKAVVMTDAIQSITMLLGAVVTLGVITYQMGGVGQWWPTQWPREWQEPSWGFDPSQRVSFGILILSTTLWYVCTNGSDQMSIQRFLSTRDPSSARRTLLVAQITDVSVSLLLAITGVALLGFYTANPPEFAAGQNLKSMGDQLFPRFIMGQMSGGLSGLVLAAILSAAMSSLSSGVNSTCAVLEKDFLSLFPRFKVSDADAVTRLRYLSFIIMAIAVGLSMLNLFIDGNLVERCFKLINLLTAPLFVLFFLALFVPWANAAGAWMGLIASVVVAVLIVYSRDLNLPVVISFVWMLPGSLLAGISVGSLSSALVGNRAKNSDQV
ncbi:MAG: sodium-coupled permease [Planctomycetes bacterium]|nr:sodium-coupled permease [Planctomycetota bacterium]NBY01656.1 sodium-coupled permease [Planctomycetota bacterium]